jgi:hypothetical protein
MDIAGWVWLLAAFWCGAFVSVLAVALVKAAHRADTRRSGTYQVRSMMTDLESDTVPRS